MGGLETNDYKKSKPNIKSAIVSAFAPIFIVVYLTHTSADKLLIPAFEQGKILNCRSNGQFAFTIERKLVNKAIGWKLRGETIVRDKEIIDLSQNCRVVPSFK